MTSFTEPCQGRTLSGVWPKRPASTQAMLTSRNCGKPIVTEDFSKTELMSVNKPETKVFLKVSVQLSVLLCNLFNYLSCVPVSTLRYLLYFNNSSNLLSAVQELCQVTGHFQVQVFSASRYKHVNNYITGLWMLRSNRTLHVFVTELAKFVGGYSSIIVMGQR